MKEEIIMRLDFLKRVDQMWEKDMERHKQNNQNYVHEIYENWRYGLSYGIKELERLEKISQVGETK